MGIPGEDSDFTASSDHLSADRYRSYCNRKGLSRPCKCLSCGDLNENSRMSTSTREPGYRRTWSQFISIFQWYWPLSTANPSCLGQWCARLPDMIPTFGMQFYASEVRVDWPKLWRHLITSKSCWSTQSHSSDQQFWKGWGFERRSRISWLEQWSNSESSSTFVRRLLWQQHPWNEVGKFLKDRKISHDSQRKPEHRFYLLACERNNIIPSEAVFLDDIRLWGVLNLFAEFTVKS